MNGSILFNTSATDSSESINYLLYTHLTANKLMPCKYSGFLQLAKKFNLIFKGALSMIYSPTNYSVIAMPSLDYSVAKNWELNFTGPSFFELEDSQTLGNILFVRLRWSF